MGFFHKQYDILCLTIINKGLDNMKFYKYCTFDKYTIENILKSQAYINTVNNFNDPFEFNPQAFENISHRELLEGLIDEYRQILFNFNSNVNNDFIKKYIEYLNPLANETLHKWIEKYIIKWQSLQLTDLQEITIPIELWEQLKKEHYEFNNEFFPQIGVYCISSLKDNILMWSHYANNHKGICLEFEINFNYVDFMATTVSVETFLDIQTLQNNFFSYGLTNVKYDEKRPLFSSLSSSNFFERNGALILTKYKQWKYEQEYRITFAPKKDAPKIFPRTVNYFPNCLTGIFLGAKMTLEDEQTINLLVEKLQHKPLLYKAELDDYEYKLNIKPLKD